MLRQEKNNENRLFLIKIEASEGFHMQSFALDIRDKVLLFDFDGTIVETESLAQKVIDDYFSSRNDAYRPPSHLIIGRTWQAAVASMHAHAKEKGCELEAEAVLLNAFKTGYLQKLKEGVDLIPGFLSLVPELKRQAKVMAIVTGSTHEEVQTILQFHKLAPFFDHIIAYGDYAMSKPDPSPFLKALEILKAEASEAIVFEDSEAGMESATRAGLPFIQICHESHAKVADPRAVKVLKNWTELLLQ